MAFRMDVTLSPVYDADGNVAEPLRLCNYNGMSEAVFHAPQTIEGAYVVCETSRVSKGRGAKWKFVVMDEDTKEIVAFLRWVRGDADTSQGAEEINSQGYEAARLDPFFADAEDC